MVRPVIAPAFKAPFDVSGADVFYLCSIAQEGISCEHIALRPRSKMDADIAAFKAVAINEVFVGVVNERAFVCPTAHQIA